MRAIAGALLLLMILAGCSSGDSLESASENRVRLCEKMCDELDALDSMNCSENVPSECARTVTAKTDAGVRVATAMDLLEISDPTIERTLESLKSSGQLYDTFGCWHPGQYPDGSEPAARCQDLARSTNETFTDLAATARTP